MGRKGSQMEVNWKTIESAPTDETVSFLVFCKSKYLVPVILQVSRFEGQLYPDAMEHCIDWDDRIKSATHWAELPEFPK